MSTDLIVSYDGTPNDDDAIALAQILARAGSEMALAYVRHAREFDPRREEMAQHDAERRLELGATRLGNPSVSRHVVISASTGEGLRQLAERTGIPVVVFASDYRTRPGHAEPGTSAQYLLEGGPVAVALAAAGMRVEPAPAIKTIGVLSAAAEAAVQQSAEALAAKLDATLLDNLDGGADLIVVASQGSPGRVSLNGSTRSRLNGLSGSILVLPAGQKLDF